MVPKTSLVVRLILSEGVHAQRLGVELLATELGHRCAELLLHLQGLEHQRVAEAHVAHDREVLEY